MKIIKLFTNNWKTIIPIVISIISFVYTGVIKTNMNDKYNKLSTYMKSLNYEIKIDSGEGRIQFGDEEIKGGQIDVIPKIGGIEAVYAVHYYKNNVKAILPVELDVDAEKYDAQGMFYRLSDYTIDNVALTTNVYYGTLYLVVKDFENNYFTNMIIYEVDKDDMSIFKTRTYSEIDLLYNYNEDINVLPEFDANQMKEYQSLKKKLDEIL
ncbi:hypothetical protein [Dorea formicigenerans]|uniref:Uncharacterized protein n=1 Tax=Dorea formicigenerans TaxID=39486 RepID=A0A3E5EHJ6_9FIRM|nr:hypothetical protein [Dorea formicigenerans]RGN88409.1 hypothetical protein DXB36_13680 [Dorea formicigenerans]